MVTLQHILTVKLAVDYLNNGYTLREISPHTGVSLVTLRRWINQAGFGWRHHKWVFVK